LEKRHSWLELVREGQRDGEELGAYLAFEAVDGLMMNLQIKLGRRRLKADGSGRRSVEG
jgi:hypothetical protein